MTPFRHPDKPQAAPDSMLSQLRDGDWLAQHKPDGYRCLILWDGRTPTFRSRHNKPLAVTQGLADEVAASLRGIGSPALIDAEWMGRRDGQPESVYLFDLLMVGGYWIGHHGVRGRFGTLCGAVVPSDRVRIVPWALSNYSGFYERSKTSPGVEGIVLKRTESPYIGSTRGSAINPHWLKIKWRA